MWVEPAIRREGKSECGVVPDALAALGRYAWPGNVRELENVIERSLALSKDNVLLPSDLPPEISRSDAAISALGPNLIEDRPTLGELERRYIELVLREAGGNKKRAAELLGIDRRTLYRTLERDGRDDDSDNNES